MKPLTKTTLEDQATESLRAAIRNGEFAPGQRLVEAQIAARMGVSRLPVREAIRSLERDGLVVSVPGRGATVVTMSQSDVAEVYGLRSALEAYAVELVIERRDSSAVERLQALVDAMTGPAAEGSRARLVDIDLRFHETLCELSANRRLVEAWRRLSDQIQLLLRLKDMVSDDSGRLPSGHQRIIDAVARGDVATAQAVLRTHIQMSADQLVAIAFTDDQE